MSGSNSYVDVMSPPPHGESHYFSTELTQIFMTKNLQKTIRGIMHVEPRLCSMRLPSFRTMLCKHSGHPSNGTIAAVLAGITILLGCSIGICRDYGFLRRRNCMTPIFIAGSAVARRIADNIRTLVVECFPESFRAGDDAEDIISELCGFYDENVCQWLLSFDSDGALLGLGLLVPLQDCLYVANICVACRARRRGLGSRLMRSASAYAHSCALKHLCGTVALANRDSAHLQCFYQRLGGEPEPPLPMSDESQRRSIRYRAPSGPATAAGESRPCPYSIRCCHRHQAARREH